MNGTRGLSLIELVVAMALFALVAVMGLQTLNGTIRTRDALSDRDNRDRDLALTLALMRTDLDYLAPLLFYPPQGAPESAVHLDDGGGRFGLSIAVAGEADGGATFQRAEWRLDPDSGQLSRSVWPVTMPDRVNQRHRDRVLLSGVQSIRFRSYWIGLGWVAGTGTNLFGRANAPPDPADGDAIFARVRDVYSDTLPAAIEIVFTLDGVGEIRILEALQ
jgi:general secretion pathway protein J